MTRKPRIDSIGLPTHLANTKDQHNGLDYQYYAILKRAGVNVTGWAKAFAVTRKTMTFWDSVDEMANLKEKV